MKKLVSTILTLALVCAIVPWSALQVQAEEPATTTPPTVTIGGKTLTTETPYFSSNGTAAQESAPATDGYAHLSGNVLTLSDFTLTATTTTAIEIRGGTCTINLVGNSTVKSADAASGSSYGILANGGDLTFEGNGALTVTGGKATYYSHGVRADNGAITVKSGTLTAEGGTSGSPSYGVYVFKNAAGGHVIVEKDALLKAKGGTSESDSTGVQADATVTINGT